MRRRTFYNDELRVAYAARFAAELAEILYEVGITHRELAEELGVAHATVDSWTRVADPKVPGEHNLHRLSEFLETRKPGAGARIVGATGQPINRQVTGISSPAVSTFNRRGEESGATAEIEEGTRPQADTLPVTPSNLLPALTQFVGRDEEIIEVRRLLQSVRLLTLVGAGGIGKTRLALEVAHGLDDFLDGVWLVELDALLEPELIPATIAQVLPGGQNPGTVSAESLAARIGEKRLLLVLDNCEHLVEACAEASETLLQKCPNVSILATSREALGCPGEVVWQVRTLSTPQSKDGGDLLNSDALCSAVAESEAGQLFIARARARQASFTLTPENATYVAEICNRLDGIPLALELAAARVSAMSVEEIAQRLDSCLQLLTHGRRARLPRQQALHASLDWSHGLLTPSERVLFRRLSVFVGGWTLGTAEGICAGSGLSTYGVLNNLMQLVDKSLVLAEQVEKDERVGGTSGGTRYRFLETVRQYALEQLTDSNEAETFRLRHAQFFTSLVERASTDFYSHTSALGHTQVLAELDNVRAALAWTTSNTGDSGNKHGGAPGPLQEIDSRGAVSVRDAIEHSVSSVAKEERSELGLRIVGALDPFYGSRGELAEAQSWVEKALAQSDSSRRTAARARALTMVGRIKIQNGQFAGLQDSLAESESIWRELGDKSGLAQTLPLIGAGYMNTGRLEEGRALLAESQTLIEEVGDNTLLAFTLFARGNIELDLGDLETAYSCLQRSVAVCEANGIAAFRTAPMVSLARVSWLKGDYEVAQAIVEDALVARIEHRSEWPIAGAQNSLADIVRCLGDYERAASLASTSLVTFRKLGDRSSTAWALYTLGNIAVQEGDYVQAVEYLTEGLLIDREVGKDKDAITCLASLACAYFGSRQLSRAAKLFGAVDQLLEKANVRWSPYDEETYERSRVATREALDAARFQGDWEEGRALSAAEAVAVALCEIEVE